MHHLWPAAAVLLVSGGVIVLGLSPEPPLPENIFFFLGRFHPLVVHLPIGLLAALAVLQGVQWAFRWDLDRAIRVLLWLCAASAVASTLFGTLLAWPGGYSGDLLGLHRWAGIGTTIVAVWMLWAHHLRGAAGRAVYAALLLLALVLVGAAGHFGGSLTHGEDYLTAYLPEALGGAPEPAPLDTGSKEDAAVYAAAVRPVLEAKCVECHNATKSNGELRMDTLAGLLAGGKHGPALKPGDAAASLMIERAHLPLDNKEHMPPEGKPQPTEAELELLSWWINRGAVERLPLGEDLPPKDALALLEEKLGFAVAAPELPMLPWEEVVKVGAPLADVPNLAVRRASMDSPALNVFIASGAPDPDALIASLEPLKANIILLDAGKTGLTSASFPVMATFANLEELRVPETSADDEDVAVLAPLRKLKKINLNGTDVTDTTVEFLSKFPELVQLAAWETTVSPVAAEGFIKTRLPEEKKRRVLDEIEALKSRLAAMNVEVLGITVPDQPPPPMVDGELYWAPLASSASSEFDDRYKVQKLHDGSVKLADIGTPNNQGGDYAGRGPGPHVVVYDMGSTISASGLLYAQRAHPGDKAARLEIRATNTDPGAAAADLAILKREPDRVIQLKPSAANDRALTKYGFGRELKGRYFVITIHGPSGNLGGYELVLGRFPLDRETLTAAIAADPARYGTLIGPKAKATLSSDSDYTPPDGLVKFLDPAISEIPFAFHTDNEKHPWVKLTFPAKVRLSAMTIVNRRELFERAAGLELQRLTSSGEWETIWQSDQPREVWNVDLTGLPPAERESGEFRLYVAADAMVPLHLANLSLWGHDVGSPAPASPQSGKKP
ncbi:MAG: c-type cytochrome domain-containing protein [Chthoniobacterales bacterium]